MEAGWPAALYELGRRRVPPQHVSFQPWMHGRSKLTDAGGTIHTLLYLQAFLLSLGAIPFYALGRQRGGSAFEAGLLAASYLLLPPLHRLIEKDYFRTDQLLFPVLAMP